MCRWHYVNKHMLLYSGCVQLPVSFISSSLSSSLSLSLSSFCFSIYLQTGVQAVFFFLSCNVERLHPLCTLASCCCLRVCVYVCVCMCVSPDSSDAPLTEQKQWDWSNYIKRKKRAHVQKEEEEEKVVPPARAPSSPSSSSPTSSRSFVIWSISVSELGHDNKRRKKENTRTDNNSKRSVLTQPQPRRPQTKTRWRNRKKK